MSVRTTARPLPTALAAAALVGGLAVTTAAPALAAPAETADGHTFAYFSHESTDGANATFYTMHTPPSDVRVTMAPFTPADPAAQTSLAGETGPATVVESAYDAELERGTVDLLEQRRALGEAGTGHVVVSLQVDGQSAGPVLRLGPDADLSDDVPGELQLRYGPQDYGFEHRPSVDHVTRLAAPDSRMVYLQGGSTGDVPGGGTLTVAEQPEHGTLVELAGTEGPAPVDVAERWASTVYVADEGFTGTDQAVFTLTDESSGETKTLVVTFSVGDERADDTVLEPQAGGLPYDESRVWAALDAQGEDDETEEDAEHTVPDTVETGSGQAWWLVAVAAAGTGALVAGRRRFGMVR